MKIRYVGLTMIIILLIGLFAGEPVSSVRVRAPAVIGPSIPGQEVVAQDVWLESAGGNGNTYQAILVRGGITWDDANKAANSRGGHLATIGSKAENLFVYGLISLKNTGQLWAPPRIDPLSGNKALEDNPIWHIDHAENIIGPWLGGYRPHDFSDPSSQWSWVGREPWGRYTNWAPGEPNNLHGIEDRLIYFSLLIGYFSPCGKLEPGERCIASVSPKYSSGDYWKGFPCEVRTNGYIVEYEKSAVITPPKGAVNTPPNFIAGGLCSPLLDGCGGGGEVQLKQVFFDDFRGGSQNWNLQDGWSLEKSGGNDVLRGRGHKFAVLKGPEQQPEAVNMLNNYALKARFKKNQGNIHFNFRSNALPDGLYRYFVGIAGNQLYLKKQNGNNNFQNLIATNLNLDANWHWIEIKGNGDTIKILIDSQACICYRDSRPIVSGGVSFETLENSDVLIDDVTISLF